MGSGWCPLAEPPDGPGGVAGLAEVRQRPGQLLDGVEEPHPGQAPLQRADEPLRAAVAFRSADEGRGASGTQERQLVLEDGGHALAAVVVADAEPGSGAPGEGAGALAHPLAERRERLEAGAVSGGVDADALGAVVARGDEHRDLAFPGPGGGHADAPRHVQDGGNDGAAVVARSAGCADPRGCRQGVLAQQPEHRVAPALPRRPATPTTTRRLCPPRKRSQSCPRNLGTRADSASPLNGRPSSSNTWPVPIARLNDATPRPGRVDSRLRAAWPTGVAPSSPMLAAEGVSTASRRAGGCHEPRSDSLSQAGEQNPSFSEEKEAKRLCPLGLRRSGGSGDQWAKVLWFFLSRKNSLLSQGGEQCRGWQVHDRRWMAARLLVVPGSMPMIMPRSTRTGRSGQGTRVAPRQPGRASAPAFPMGLPRRRVCGRQQESRDPGARPGGP